MIELIALRSRRRATIGLPQAPAGYTLLIGSDGEYLRGPDGEYLYGPL
jgi:hypothetical protein